MSPTYTLRVLWIDDKPDSSFIQQTRQNGIDISVMTNFDDGLEALEDRSLSFDAIILDANCVVTGEAGEQPEVSSLSYAINEINRRQIDLPWFVFSGEGFEGDDALEYLVPKNRPWDDRPFYRKAHDRDVLISAIKKAVAQHEQTRIKMKYADVCNLYGESDLLDILIPFDAHDDDFDQDTTVPNAIRNIMDWICFTFFSEIFEGTNINECSRIIGNRQLERIIPFYIQRSFHLLSEYCNAGSHRYQQNDYRQSRSVRIAEGVRTDISNGSAPYLNRLATVSLLTILHWCSRLNEDKNRLFEIQEAISALNHE